MIDLIINVFILVVGLVLAIPVLFYIGGFCAIALGTILYPLAIIPKAIFKHHTSLYLLLTLIALIVLAHLTL